MINNLHKLKYFFKKQQKGMTLVELLVVLSIFIMITGLIMFDYGSFKSATSTQNLANDIALSVRKSQSYAIGVRGVSATFQYGHGIHFTTNPDNSNILAGSNKSFVLFSDVPTGSPPTYNDRYNYPSSGICSTPTSENECEEILTILGADKINAIYLEDVKKTEGMLDIVFRRPNPDAFFCFRVNVGDSCTTNASNVTIEVSNGKIGEDQITRKIMIWNTGQISVE